LPIPQFEWAQCNNGTPPCEATQELNCAIRIYSRGHWRMWPSHTSCGCNWSFNLSKHLPIHI
jgi:hypothetical protein